MSHPAFHRKNMLHPPKILVDWAEAGVLHKIPWKLRETGFFVIFKVELPSLYSRCCWVYLYTTPAAMAHCT